MRELFRAIGESFREFGSSIKGSFLGEENNGDYQASWGRVSEVLLPSSTGTGFAVTSGKFQTIEDSLEHTLICAGSGSGKSVNTTIPGILEQKEASMLALDNSGELYDLTAAAKIVDGYTVIPIDFDADPESINENSYCYNPLYRLTPDDLQGISKLANQLVRQSTDGKMDYWANKSVDVMVLGITILLLRPEEERTLHNLHILLEEMASDEDKVSEHVIGLPKEVFRKWSVLLSNSDKTLDSIRSSALAATSFISHSKALQKLTSRDNININLLRSDKVIIYLKTPIDDSTVRPIINMFFTDFFNHFLSKPRPKEKARPILVFAEEFGSTYIPGFDKIISNCRKWMIGLQMVCQSYSQIAKIYGQEGLATIKANCSKMIFTGSEEAEEISRILGKVTFTDLDSKYKHHRELMSASEIRNLDESKAIFLPRKGKPLLVNLKPFYKVRRLLKRTQLTMPVLDADAPSPSDLILTPLNLPSYGKL